MDIKATLVRTFGNKAQVLVAQPALELGVSVDAVLYEHDAAAIDEWLRFAIPGATLELVYKKLCDKSPIHVE